MDYKGQARITAYKNGLVSTVSADVELVFPAGHLSHGVGDNAVGRITRSARLTLADPERGVISNADFLILEFEEQRLGFELTSRQPGEFEGRRATTYVISPREVGYIEGLTIVSE